tara:strand:+ start:13334 stop:14170 length:837 start_codon:yes stop_codon:yes gene_type:complete
MYLTSFIVYNKLLPSKRIYSNKKQITKMFMNPLPGIEVGIPLNIFQNVFTQLHYGKDITTPLTIMLQFSLGYFCYGLDRFLDAIDDEEYKNAGERKIKLFNYIRSNKNYIATTLLLSYTFVIYTLSLEQETRPFILLIISTLQYKNLKKIFGEFKALYISIAWMCAAVLIPSIMYEHNYSILDSPQDYLPGFLTLFSSSNYADSLDIEEDKLNGIKTLPVLIGQGHSDIINIFLLGASCVIFGSNEHFIERPLVNGLYEIQNIALLSTIILKNVTNVL